MKTLIHTLRAALMVGLFSVLAWSASGQTPTQLWVQRHNGTGNSDDNPIATAVDSEGNIIVTGASSPGGFALDYYTAKYSGVTGALIWEKRYDGGVDQNDIANSVAVDNAGNVIVTGRSGGANGEPDFYTAKYASGDGTLLWEHRYNGAANGTDIAYSVGVDSAGNVAVTGSSADATGSLDVYTAKYASANGALLWEKRYAGPSNQIDEGYSLAFDGAGNVIITGASFSSTTNRDSYTAKYAAADGALLWERREWH